MQTTEHSKQPTEQADPKDFAAKNAEALKGVKIPIREVGYEEMVSTRVARYDKLQFPADRYPDIKLPGHERKNILVIGTGLLIEGGKDPMSAIPINEGFTMSYVEAKPGNGPILHNHDTNETFIAVHGAWRVIWGVDAEHHVDLQPLDVCSVPPFVPRRFINLTVGAGREEGLLISIQAGDHPKAEWISRDAEGNVVGKSTRG
jgi:mannose-6-phosphate isomerase-like protein (cupin superfamily)